MASKVDQTIRWKTPGQQPNGMQATGEGIWLIDQIDPNMVYLLDYEDGRALREISTRSHHGSGITLDPDGNIWIASTFTYEVICIDRQTGRELNAFPTPPFDKSGGPHGLEWRDDRLWVNVPITGSVLVLDPRSGNVERSFPCHGDRGHGMAWDPYDDSLWIVDTNKRVIFKLDPVTGEIRDAVGCAGPEPHGMTVWQGQFWLCDAATREVSTFDVPKQSIPMPMPNVA